VQPAVVPPPPVATVKHLGDGKGSFTSPKKSSKAVKDATGKATFAYSAESTPSGSASFKFKKGKVAFSGSTVTAASVSGKTLTVTVSGSGGLTLVLVATDGTKDTVRIKVLKAGKVVYDSATVKVKGSVVTAP
jgi:hypothetical protein